MTDTRKGLTAFIERASVPAYLFARILASLIAAFICATSIAQTVKIGILGDTDKHMGQIDDLTRLLSETPNVSVVERSDIDRILAEHSISLSSFNDSCAEGGRLIGADGLIVIKEFSWDGKTALGVRLVSVRTGAVVGSWIQSLSADESCHWSKTVKDIFLPLLPKLEVSKEEAIPLSLLYFHSLDNSQASKDTERALTIMMGQRLTLEKEFFVLDRWKLGNIGWEKSLNLDDSPFWTGSWTVSGRIDRIHRKEGVSWVELTVELASKDSKTPISIQHSGSLNDIPGLVDSIAKEIRNKIGKGSAQPLLPFDATAEAELYVQESLWALSNKCYELALNAAESAKALGRKDVVVDYVIVLSAAGHLNDVIKPRFRKYDGYNVSMYLPPSVGNGEVEGMIKSLSGFDEFIKSDPAPTNLTFFLAFDDWRVIGGDLLNKAGCVLRSLYNSPKLADDPGLAAKTALLREMSRNHIDLMQRLGRGDNMELFYKCLLVYMPYFHENQQETFKALDALLKLDFPDSEGMRLAIRNAWPEDSGIWLVDWKEGVKAKKRQRDALNKYAKDLLASPSVASRIDALVLNRKLVTPELLSRLLLDNAEAIASYRGCSSECFELLPQYFWRLPTKSRRQLIPVFLQLARKIMQSPNEANYTTLFPLLPWDMIDSDAEKEQLDKEWKEHKARQAAAYPYNIVFSQKFRWIERSRDRNHQNWIRKGSTDAEETQLPVLQLDKRVNLKEAAPSSISDKSVSFILRDMRYGEGKILISGTIGESSLTPVLFAVDAKTLKVDAFAFSVESNGRIDPKGAISSYHAGAGFLVDASGKLYKSQDGHCSFMEDLNCKNPTSMAFANGRLYVGFGCDPDVILSDSESSSGKGWVSGIVEKKLEDGSSSSLLCCNTRNPGKTPYDNSRPYEIPHIQQGPQDEVLTGIYTRPCYRLYRYGHTSNEWTGLIHYHPGAEGRVYDSPHPGGCLFTSRNFDHIWNYNSGSGKLAELLHSPHRYDGESAKAPDCGALWHTSIYISDLINNASNSPFGRIAAFDGDHLIFVSTVRPVGGDGTPRLTCFKKGFETPFKLQLSFPPRTVFHGRARTIMAASDERIFLLTHSKYGESGNSTARGGYGATSPTWDSVLWVVDKADLNRSLDLLLPMPTISPEDTFFDGSLLVAIEDKSGKAEIRYTLDGSEPTQASKLYEVPIALDSSAFLAAKSFKDGFTTSQTAKKHFLKLPMFKSVKDSYSQNGLAYKINYGGWIDVPDFDKIKPDKTGMSDNIDLSVVGRKYSYGISFNGQIEAPADGMYKFVSSGTNTFKLFIDGTIIGGSQGRINFYNGYSFAVLEKGRHTFRIDVISVMKRGERPFKLKWEGPGFPLQEIPDKAFFPKPENTTVGNE